MTQVDSGEERPLMGDCGFLGGRIVCGPAIDYARPPQA